METALSRKNNKSDFANYAADSTGVPKRPKASRKRQSIVVVLLMSLFASVVVTTAMLVMPILSAAVTESIQHPRLSYQQCGRLREDATRLHCYDEALGQTLLGSAKDARRIGFFEFLDAQRNDQARNTSDSQR